MAFFNDTHVTRPGFFGIIANAFHNVMTSVDLAASSNARMRQLEQLNALSDEQLAAKGLRRDEITRYVFRDVLYI